MHAKDENWKPATESAISRRVEPGWQLMDGSGDGVHTHRCLSLKKVRRSRVTGKSKATTRRLKLSGSSGGVRGWGSRQGGEEAPRTRQV